MRNSTKEMKDKMSIEINKRFFEAIEYVRTTGKIRGIGTFCREYDLNRIKYIGVRQQINNPNPPEYITYKNIDVSALGFLCRDYGISPEWLLLGKGGMLK